MPKKAVKIEASKNQLEIILTMSKATHIEKHIIERSNIILKAIEGYTNTAISELLKIERNTVILWRNKWAKNQIKLNKIETETPKELKKAIKDILCDEVRSGRRRIFNQEQQAKIIAISLQSPESLGVPISNWTNAEIAKKAIELQIAETISSSQVRRFLKRSLNKSSSI